MVRRFLFTILLLTIFGFSMFVYLNPEYKNDFFINKITHEYLDTNLKRTAIAFASAKTVNAFVSLIQDMDFGFELGASYQVSPGELLDPLNDLVERFSWLMLLCFAVIGVEKIVFEIFQSVGFFLLSLCSLFFLLTMWIKAMAKLATIFVRIAALSILLLFWIPAQAVVGDFVYEKYLKKDFNETISFLDKNSDMSYDIDINKEKGFFSKLKDMANITKQINKLRNFAERSMDKFINLIIIFTLESILLPLVTFFVGTKIFSWIFKSSALNNTQKFFFQKITGKKETNIAHTDQAS